MYISFVLNKFLASLPGTEKLLSGNTKRLAYTDHIIEFGLNTCMKAFATLKEKLILAPIIYAPDWELLFELMCGVSEYAVGAVLG